MERERIIKYFEKIGARITIRKGTSPRDGVVRMNVANDRKGEHFTLTIHPDIKDSEIEVQVLDYDKELRQMLLFLRYPRLIGRFEKGRQVFRRADNKETEDVRLLVGRDEMHWFVAGVTESKNIRQAFERLRPQAVSIAVRRNGVKTKDWRKRKTKGFVRQGEWFFVPVFFVEDEKTIVIHKNEPIQKAGSKPHYVEEIVRFGGETVYTKGDIILTEEQYKKTPADERYQYRQQMRGARVIGRGKVKHPDHHTIELKGWHEIHLSTEVGVTTNAFID
jgi:hypothetical protein